MMDKTLRHVLVEVMLYSLLPVMLTAAVTTRTVRKSRKLSAAALRKTADLVEP